MDLDTRVISVTPTITAGAYSANDAVGGLLTFADAFGVNAGNDPRGAILDSVVITDLGKQDVQLDLVLFSKTFTATADNAALDVADADLPNCLGVIKLTDYADFNDSSVVTKAGIGLVIKNTGSDGSLYGQLVTRGTPTYASTSDLTVKVGIIRG